MIARCKIALASWQERTQDNPPCLEFQAGPRMRTIVRWHENGTRRVTWLGIESICLSESNSLVRYLNDTMEGWNRIARQICFISFQRSVLGAKQVLLEAGKKWSLCEKVKYSKKDEIVWRVSYDTCFVHRLSISNGLVLKFNSKFRSPSPTPSYQ